MSLEVKHIPQDYRTVYNPVEVVMYETSSTVRNYTGFAYLIDVKDGSTTVGRLKVPPTTNGYGRFDLSGIMESYLTTDIGTLNGTNIESIFFNTNSWKQFTLEFGWIHYLGGTATTSIPQDVTIGDASPVASVNLVVINGALPNYRRDLVNFYDYQSTDYYLKFITNATTRRFLTNQPKGVSQNNVKNLSLEYTDEGYLYILYDQSIGVFDSVELQTYDSSGSDLDLSVLSLQNLSSQRHLRIPSAPTTLNAIVSSRVSTGSQPIVATTATSYSLQLKNGSAYVSEKMWFNIDTACRYETRRLEFLNSLGGFDYYNFTKVSRHTEDIERKFFKTTPNDLNTSTGAIDYSIANREKVQYYTKSISKMKLISDWVDADKFNWLLELIESPEIYLLDSYTAPSGSTEIRRLPIKNIENNWEEKVNAVDNIFNLEIDLEFSMDNFRQRF